MRTTTLSSLRTSCYDMDCLVGTGYDTASVRKRPRTYLGITICLPFIFLIRLERFQTPVQYRRIQWLMGALLKHSRPHVRYRDYVRYTEMFSLLCTVHGDVLTSMYCTQRCHIVILV